MPEVALPPPTDTTTSVAPGSVTLPPSVAVTVTVVPDADSDTEVGDTVSVIAVGAVSSSVMLTVADAGRAVVSGADTRSGSSPNPNTTLSPSSSTVSSGALNEKLCSVSLPANTTIVGAPA